MNNLAKDSNSNNMTVTAQVSPPVATDTDALTLQGSHAGDTRSQAADIQDVIERAAGVTKGPRDATGTEGS